MTFEDETSDPGDEVLPGDAPDSDDSDDDLPAEPDVEGEIPDVATDEAPE